MKLKTLFLLPLVALAAAVLPQVALADSITLTLARPVQSVTNTTGGTLTFSGTITAASTNTNFEYLNSFSNTLSGPGTFSAAPYLNGAPFFLTAGQSYTGALFTVTYGSGLAIQNYLGTFSILGGSSSGAQSSLATVNFQANVAPEPSGLLLLGTGVLGAVGVMRRRLFA